MDTSASAHPSHVLRRVTKFLKQYRLRVTVISALILIPCFWHTHIQAGDLASHVYNTWLVSLIKGGQVHDLYVAPQFNNVLFDFLLYQTGRLTGFANAEKIVVPVCILIFFWGVFSLIAAASRRSPWFLTPAIAMIAYGYTFEMGFMNYYLSIGLAFLAIALVWDDSSWADRVVAAGLAILVYLAHPVGLATLVAILVYVKLSQRLGGWWRVLPFALAIGALFALHRYIHKFRTAWGLRRWFYQINGADQLVLFGPVYRVLAWIVVALAVVAIGIGLRRQSLARDQLLATEIATGLWLALVFSSAVIPLVIWVPQYSAAFAMITTRSTCIAAALVVLILGCLRPQRWHAMAFGLCAIVFFALLYRDTGRLDRLETQAGSLLRGLPQGTRVVATIGPTPGSRIWYVLHLVNRACIGHCFTYNNYEPSTSQFWIRIRPGSRTAAASNEDVGAMEVGLYKVKPDDLPLTQLYQCSVDDFDHLCLRELKAGELNCPDCNNPYYPTMHGQVQPPY